MSSRLEVHSPGPRFGGPGSRVQGPGSRVQGQGAEECAHLHPLTLLWYPRYLLWLYPAWTVRQITHLDSQADRWVLASCCTLPPPICKLVVTPGSRDRGGVTQTYYGRDEWRFEGCPMGQTYTPGRAAIPGWMCIWARVGIGPAACAVVFMARSNGATYGVAPSG